MFWGESSLGGHRSRAIEGGRPEAEPCGGHSEQGGEDTEYFGDPPRPGGGGAALEEDQALGEGPGGAEAGAGENDTDSCHQPPGRQGKEARLEGHGGQGARKPLEVQTQLFTADAEAQEVCWNAQRAGVKGSGHGFLQNS